MVKMSGARGACAHALGLSDVTTFLGWRSQADVYALQAASTLCVMPSRNTRTEYTEGLGLVALEAAAVGRAIVGTRVGGVSEAIAHGETGLLVEPDDAAATAHAIPMLLFVFGRQPWGGRRTIGRCGFLNGTRVSTRSMR